MTSLLQDLAREYQAALVGFGQVFLASAGFVAIACLLKWCLLPKQKAPIVRKPRQRKARGMGTELAKANAERSSALAQSHSTAMTSDIAVSRPMPPEAHCQRAVAPVRRVIACGERARELHDRAFVRLEAADYAFQRLLLEIAPFTAPIREPEVHQPTLPIVISQEHAVRLAA